MSLTHKGKYGSFSVSKAPSCESAKASEDWLRNRSFYRHLIRAESSARSVVTHQNIVISKRANVGKLRELISGINCSE